MIPYLICMTSRRKAQEGLCSPQSASLARAMVEMAQMSLEDQEGQLDRMRRRGREHVIKNFNWDKAAESTSGAKTWLPSSFLLSAMLNLISMKMENRKIEQRFAVYKVKGA